MTYDEGDDFMQKCKALLPIIAIVLISITLWFSLLLGYNGTILLGGMAAISGIAGFSVREIYELLKTRE